MDPLDFITLAIKLSNSPYEAERRTAVSRAYYGSFHLARKFLEHCGVNFFPKELDAAEIHRKVRFCLSESQNADAVFAAKRLRSLRQQRNQADYDLDSTEFNNVRKLGSPMRSTQEIVDALQRCRAEPDFSKVRDCIKAYARDVLRLSVQDD